MTALNSMSSQIKTQPRTISPTLTEAGVMAAINVPKTGIEVAVTHIAFGTGKYRPNGAETGLQHEIMRVAIAGGGKVSPTQIQVHAEAIAPVGSPFWCGEIGFYADDTLFAVYSKPDQPILYFADDSVTTVSYTLGLTALPADTVTVLVDPNVNTAIQLIGAHETAKNPHPQYQYKLGFIPVQQGTGHGQKSNTVKMGWSGDSLKVTVDDTDHGAVIFQSNLEVALNNYLPLTGGKVTGQLLVQGSTGAIGAPGASGPGRPCIEVSSAGGEENEAYMTFHRPGVFAMHFGLDAQNDLSIGGYSLGANAYKLWHAGNFIPGSKQDALGYKPSQAVGSWLNSVIVDDSRAKYYAPKDRDMGIYFDFRNNDAGNLDDGGVQHGAITFRQWGAGDDFSGGPAHQLGFTANGNLFHRTGKGSAWEKYQRLLHAGQNGTLPDGGIPIIKDCNAAPLGWATYTQEATANRPSAYGQIFTSSLNGTATPGNGNWLMQRGFSTEGHIFTRVNIGDSGWGTWLQAWTNANFDPGSKANGAGFSLHWSGQDGQPTWLLGGNTPEGIYVYNPSSFRVAYAASAGGATNAENISNGNSYMRMSWSDPGGQTTYLWGSDGPTGARLCATGNLSVGDSRKWNGFPLRYAENPPANQPYYVLGIEAGASVFSIYNRAAMAVSSSVTSVYAHQLTGQGLGYGGIGGYILNKRKDGTGLAGIWEQRGQVYDYGSGAVEGNESSSVLWQRVA
ncbi:tail-collar fiber protein [Collimonas sp. PA-H2]|uniref:phage tail-collar fiber domain-containing protein n=1 Tax=Collimonas sp. PA-H2 TaxID=1881062 RepID=UPI000C00E0D2|nr:phage tail protein [Collimonas sp. PA-H2]PFH08094.1 tail-collar fiber protein [Collimonas sp. PA-H2]